MVADVDEDGSGEIDFDEFFQMMTKGSAESNPVVKLYDALSSGELGDRSLQLESLLSTYRRRVLLQSLMADNHTRERYYHALRSVLDNQGASRPPTAPRPASRPRACRRRGVRGRREQGRREPGRGEQGPGPAARCGNGRRAARPHPGGGAAAHGAAGGRRRGAQGAHAPPRGGRGGAARQAVQCVRRSCAFLAAASQPRRPHPTPLPRRHCAIPAAWGRERGILADSDAAAAEAVPAGCWRRWRRQGRGGGSARCRPSPAAYAAPRPLRPRHALRPRHSAHADGASGSVQRARHPAHAPQRQHRHAAAGGAVPLLPAASGRVASRAHGWAQGPPPPAGSARPSAPRPSPAARLVVARTLHSVATPRAGGGGACAHGPRRRRAPARRAQCVGRGAARQRPAGRTRAFARPAPGAWRRCWRRHTGASALQPAAAEDAVSAWRAAAGEQAREREREQAQGRSVGLCDAPQ